MDLETQKYLGERKNPITIYDELDYTRYMMTKYTIEEARHIVINCSKDYKRLLADKEFIIVYRD